MRPVNDAVRLGRDSDPLVYDRFIVKLVIPLFSYYFARISTGRSGDTGSHPSPRGRSGDGEGVSRRRDRRREQFRHDRVLRGRLPGDLRRRARRATSPSVRSCSTPTRGGSSASAAAARRSGASSPTRANTAPAGWRNPSNPTTTRVTSTWRRRAHPWRAAGARRRPLHWDNGRVPTNYRGTTVIVWTVRFR